MTTLQTGFPMLENPMVIGEYYTDTDTDRIMEQAGNDDMIDYIWDAEHVTDMVSDWLGEMISSDAAYEIFESLQEGKLERLCRKWVEKHCIDNFVAWMTRKGRA